METTAPGYVVIIEGNDTDGQGYSAYSPDLPGCIATGSTYDECVTTMREAMAGHLEVMREYGDPRPELARRSRRCRGGATLDHAVIKRGLS